MARIYEICESPNTFQNICLKTKEVYRNITNVEIMSIIGNLAGRKLLIYDKNKYLSLAIPFKLLDEMDGDSAITKQVTAEPPVHTL